MKLHVKPAKYHNTPVEVDGIRFDSKAEAARYVQLKALRASGRILWFTRQPSFLLLGNTRYRPDFMVCNSSGLVWVEDVKGVETKEFKIKKKDWEALYPGFELRVVK